MPYPRKELDIVHDKTVTKNGAWFARSMPISREAMLKNVFSFWTNAAVRSCVCRYGYTWPRSHPDGRAGQRRSRREPQAAS